MNDMEFLISKLAADLDVRNIDVIANDRLVLWITEYFANTDKTYEQLLAQANTLKPTLRR